MNYCETTKPKGIADSTTRCEDCRYGRSYCDENYNIRVRCQMFKQVMACWEFCSRGEERRGDLARAQAVHCVGCQYGRLHDYAGDSVVIRCLIHDDLHMGAESCNVGVSDYDI